ncbi:MAG: patatin-like phospholipase family protein [Alphaproteobacteria bacterium]|nr:patatin-like phospholipase family protein [Alphaproteobacteria bacterium]
MKRFAWVMLLVLSACSAMPAHHPVPQQKLAEAQLAGYPPSIRFWADEAPPDILPRIRQRLDAYRQANSAYFNRHGHYPPLHYLAISGGAYDGAFAAGLLHGWQSSGTRPDFALVTGVSAGALIAPFVFVGTQHDHQLRELFTSSDSSAIFETSTAQVLDGLTGGLAVTNSAPLAKKIQSNITPELMQQIAARHREGRRLFIGTTNLEAQRGVIWDIGEIANSGNPGSLALIHRIMLASASVPGLFEPVFFDVVAGGERYTEIHTDGGVTAHVFMYPLRIQRRVIDEFEHHGLKRHLYVIRNSKVTPEYEALDPGLFSLSRRSIETLTKYHSIGDLYRLYVGAQRDGVDYNLAVIPDSFRVHPRELFDPVYMSALFEVGVAMGKERDMWLKKPPGADYLK